jgi:predicted RNase H-like HicB family nuclease
MLECDFRRSGHPAHVPDLAPCDFILFDYLHKIVGESLSETVEELKEKIKVFIQAISKSRLIAIF